MKIIVGKTDLATTNPELVKEWDYNKNDVTPQEVSKGMTQKLWWLCSLGHSYEASPNSRTSSGQGCPYCSGHKVLKGFNDIATTNPEILIEWDYEKNKLTPYEVSKGMHIKIWFRCQNKHSYEMILNNKSKERGCPYCSGRRTLKGYNDLATTHSYLVKEWDYEKNEISPYEVSYGSSKIVYWRCNLNPSYKSRISQRTRGQGCPYCSGQRVLQGYNDLVTTHPNLCKEWDYEKNDVRPNDISKGSRKKIWWLCSNLHSYQSNITDRISGDACPYCSGRRVIKGQTDLATNYPNLIIEWNHEKNIINPDDVSCYSSKIVWWKCSLGHSYKTSIIKRTSRGHGCPYCSNHRILQGFNDLATTHKGLCKEWDYSKNEIKPTEIFKCSNLCAWWVCPKNHSYKMSVSSRTSKGNSCPYCSGQKVLKGYNDIATTNPEILTEWDYNKNEIKPTEISRGSEKKIWWVCTEFHSYNSSVSNKINGCGCPYCAGKKVLKGFNDLMTTNPELCKEWDYEKNGNLTPYDISKGTHKKVWWKCANNHFFLMKVANRACLGQGCPYCSGSKMERFLYDYLKRENILFQREKKFKDLYISYYPYDVYCKKENVIIEADGIQHFESIDFFTENISFEERVRRDNLKNTYCLNNNISILRIPYIYDVVKDKDKIENLVLKFIQTKEVPKEIIEYYEKYDFSNYSKVVTVLNKKFKSY